MSFPLMNKRARQGVVIPELSGGLNLRDSVSMANDNQLTDAVNMWFKDGVLKTRPGVEAINSVVMGRTAFKNKFFKTHSDITTSNGTLVSCCTVYENSVIISFFWIEIKEGNPSESNYTEPASIQIQESLSNVNYFAVKHKDDVFLFFSAIKSSGEKIRTIYKRNLETVNGSAKEIWSVLPESELYVPIVYAHCLRQGYSSTFEATQVEGYNLINPMYKMIYTAYNPNDLDSDHCMQYVLGQPIPKGYTGKLKVINKYYDSGNKTLQSCEHTIDFTADIEGTGPLWDSVIPTDPNRWIIREGKGASNKDDGYYLYCGKHADTGLSYVGFGKIVNGKKEDVYINDEETLSRYKGIIDNIIIEAPTENENAEKVFGMTRSEWFGGNSVGLNGGTRLFLGGNNEEKALVLYSGLNNPLYFPENCYFYAGNNAEPVTAFGKQSDMLIIFKEKETYFTQYSRNDSITADSLIDQSVVDYTANSVYFPLTLINSNTGCDCPDTVQLCRNRLVWANSNGKVYTLTSANQYSERNVYEVGEMVERKLKGEISLKTATSCDWNGHYVLFVGSKAYLMDYNSSGYQYVYSYQKNEDSNINIPWQIWEFGFDNLCDIVPLKNHDYITVSGYIYTYDTEAWYSALYRFSYDDADNIYNITGKFSDVKAEKQQTPIHSSLTTKLFDFGMAGYRKNVDLVQLSLGNNGGAPINVDFVTDCGTVSEEVTLTSDETENYTAGYVSSVGLNPSIRSVLRFGVRLTCEGKLAVDGMSLNYRILGGAR